MGPSITISLPKPRTKRGFIITWSCIAAVASGLWLGAAKCYAMYAQSQDKAEAKRDERFSTIVTNQENMSKDLQAMAIDVGVLKRMAPTTDRRLERIEDALINKVAAQPVGAGQ